MGLRGSWEPRDVELGAGYGCRREWGGCCGWVDMRCALV